jgi:uncharacterized protein YlzI (FlbEa/FlbD family)
MFDMKKLVESYCGDLCWLEELKKQIEENADKIENIETVRNLLATLFNMNYVVVETETEEYASKYNIAVADIYCQMKYDLTTMLGINEFWEMI